LRKENPDMFGKYVDNGKLLGPIQIFVDATKRKT
jgi:hypothetical protein